MPGSGPCWQHTGQAHGAAGAARLRFAVSCVWPACLESSSESAAQQDQGVTPEPQALTVGHAEQTRTLRKKLQQVEALEARHYRGSGQPLDAQQVGPPAQPGTPQHGVCCVPEMHWTARACGMASRDCSMPGPTCACSRQGSFSRTTPGAAEDQWLQSTPPGARWAC